MLNFDIEIAVISLTLGKIISWKGVDPNPVVA